MPEIFLQGWSGRSQADPGWRPRPTAERVRLLASRRARLLMNPAVMRSDHLPAVHAIEAVETELAGRHPGRIIFPTRRPDATMLQQATGHRQVMDFWLAQIEVEHHCTLVTNDASLAEAWPEWVTRAG